MAESTPSILARLKSVGIDPKFFEELCDALEDYSCVECSYSDLPTLGVKDRHVIMFCPICNDDAPDPVAAKA